MTVELKVITLNVSPTLSHSNLIFLSMNEQLKSDLLKQEADEFWQECERKAAELEITVDYYLDEFL